MKKNSILRFGFKFALLVLIVFVPYFILLKNFIKTSDPFYFKTTHKGENLIIGDSRVQKGISPAILKGHLNDEKEWLNLAFTGLNSPYGDIYNNFIKRKFDSSRGLKDHIFILGVNPGMIMELFEGGKTEEDFRVFNLLFVNQNPNFEYIIRNTNGVRPLLNELLIPAKKEQIIHEDGWVEVPEQLEDRPRFNRLGIFSKFYVRSHYREQKLSELVNYFVNYGKVYLVRMPANKRLSKLEDEFAPHFQSFIENLATNKRVYYLDYSNDGECFEFYDHYHHLSGNGARDFNAMLANDIEALN